MDRRMVKRDLIIEGLLVLFAIPSMFPIYLMVISSFKQNSEIYHPFSLPKVFQFENYLTVFKKVDVFLVLGNTIYICFGAIILLVLVSSIAGYRISRRNSKILNFILFLFITGIIIPMQANMVPTYKLGQYLHLLNTRTFLVLLYAAGTIPFATMIYVGFTKNIPREIEEAATIDGCGSFRMFWKILFPLLMPATGTVIATIIFFFWNDFQGPLIYLNDPQKQTLIAQIFRFKQDMTSVKWGPLFALCVMAMLPIVIIFMFVQKHLIRGLVAGAVKG